MENSDDDSWKYMQLQKSMALEANANYIWHFLCFMCRKSAVAEDNMFASEQYRRPKQVLIKMAFWVTLTYIIYVLRCINDKWH